MKKLAITLLSLLLCSPVFGAYSSFKRIMPIAGKITYGAYLAYPGFKYLFNQYKYAETIENDTPPVSDEITKEVHDELKKRGIQDTNNMKVIYDRTIDSAAIYDPRSVGKPVSILIRPEFMTYLEQDEKSILLAHEAGHIKNYDGIIIFLYNCLATPAGHLAHSLLLRHPVAKAIQAITTSKNLGNAFSKTIQVAWVEAARRILMDEPYYMLRRAQETRADTALLENSEEYRTAAEFWINNWYNIHPSDSKKSRKHPPSLDRGIHLVKASKTKMPKGELSSNKKGYIYQYHRNIKEEERNITKKSPELLTELGNKWMTLYLSTSEKIIIKSQQAGYSDPLEKSIQCHKKAKELQYQSE